MKIEQKPTVFQPVTITLETEEDMRELAAIVRFAHQQSQTGTFVDQWSYKLARMLEDKGLYLK